MRNPMISVFCAAAGLTFAVLAPTAALSDSGSTPVLHTELEGMDGTEANIVHWEVEPGFETNRHIHSGHVFVYVLDGSITIDVEGREPQTFSAGEAFYELPDVPMVGRNASPSENARFVVFQVGPTGEPLMVDHPQ